MCQQRLFQSDLAGLIDSMRDTRKTVRFKGLGHHPKQDGCASQRNKLPWVGDTSEFARCLSRSSTTGTNARIAALFYLVLAKSETADNLDIDVPFTISIRTPCHAVVARVLNSEDALLFSWKSYLFAINWDLSSAEIPSMRYDASFFSQYTAMQTAEDWRRHDAVSCPYGQIVRRRANNI
jgi:hypothetical protein